MHCIILYTYTYVMKAHKYADFQTKCIIEVSSEHRSSTYEHTVQMWKKKLVGFERHIE